MVFGEAKSTGPLVDSFANEINQNIDSKKFVVIAFIDLIKAFDTLDHSILLEKLKNNGIVHKTLHLLKNYLNERFQVTKIGDLTSSKIPVRYGLVQGSILSPGFYNRYICSRYAISKS